MTAQVGLASAILLGFGVLVLMLCSSFIKISVVLLILRNALGLQQAPANSVVFSLAILLSIFVAAPMLTDIGTLFASHPFDATSFSDLAFIIEKVAGPVEKFLRLNVDQKSLEFVERAALDLWKKEELESGLEKFITVLTAFTLSELKKAFFIGFMLYLPFLIIDLVVTTILLALGMMMVSPPMISVPFKLLLFVGIEGWTRIFSNFILSYQYA